MRPCTVGHVARQLGTGISTAEHLVERLAHLDLLVHAEKEQDQLNTIVAATVRGESFSMRCREALHLFGECMNEIP
ncbi:hypothetical protein EI42_01429 [Thermosporothrix hazakensis]|uniref:Uncharacterized protein n=1 Tax=Thermosporothrix hazakensis TaxID=644383 RepID=A0A326UDR9_THEHA|nr:hypothetical protein [Thermosporothrix hazakensis]PZW32884.1 hypothetical protein EI42_01429 [Thermosporothrix hazakensis]